MTFVRDHILQLGLSAVLSTSSVVSDVRHCRSWHEVQQSLRAGPTDVLFLHESDFGPEHIVPVDTRGVRPKVLLLLGSGAEDRILSGSPSADGFLVQGELTATAVEEALHKTAQGHVPMPGQLARELLQRAHGARQFGQRRDMSLTERENEVLLLLSEGLSNKQIARRLQISSHGAKRIVASLLLKLGAPNRTAAVVHAIQAGLIKC
ncbi:response regulator transcription factor [Streptomyces sp. NPDC026206]|uniref:response regulator transcription factor n=1 Tax=Streptomyces sp. NPDC026206 TaxID=3157089 RepID=UPI0033F6D329